MRRLRTGSRPLSTEIHIREGQILTGPLFSEPMQVETLHKRARCLGLWTRRPYDKTPSCPKIQTNPRPARRDVSDERCLGLVGNGS